MIWKIEITPTAAGMLEGIKDRRIRESICGRIDGLVSEPEKQGYPLTAELTGYRSLRAVGQRFRIIYHVDKSKIVVIVVAAGIRKDGDKRDIYALAQKLIRTGLAK